MKREKKRAHTHFKSRRTSAFANVNEFISSPVFNSFSLFFLLLLLRFRSVCAIGSVGQPCFAYSDVPYQCLQSIMSLVSYFAFVANDSLNLFFFSSFTFRLRPKRSCHFVHFNFCFSTRKRTESHPRTRMKRSSEKKNQRQSNKTVTSSTQNVQLCIVWQILAHKTNQIKCTEMQNERNVLKMLPAQTNLKLEMEKYKSRKNEQSTHYRLVQVMGKRKIC